MELTLEAESRDGRGTGAAKRLRATKRIPGVLYGPGVDNTPLSVDWPSLRAVLAEGGNSALVNLTLDGEEHLTIIYEVQKHPVRLDVNHVDFLAVERGKPIQVEVPFRLEGRAEKVSQQGAVVEQQLNSLLVEAAPRNVPAELVLDITEMTLEENLTVADLVLPEGVTLVDLDEDQVLAVGKKTRATLAMEREKAAAEAGEGEFGELAGAGEGESAED